jgi:hypothetical protein
MATTPAEMMKEYVNSQNFSSTTEVMSAMKEMFKDALQQVIESELEAYYHILFVRVILHKKTALKEAVNFDSNIPDYYKMYGFHWSH